jgi:hypothetical protein
MQDVRIVFDTTEAEAQMDELTKALKTYANDFLFGTTDSLPDELIENILRLPFNVVLRDGRTALGADGVLEKRFFIRGDSLLEELIAALRAGKGNDFLIAHGISNVKL